MQQGMPASFREQILTQTEGENRVVTVLFADMCRSVETTRDLHPEEGAALISRLLRAMVDVLIGCGGRVDGFRGDGLLAVFGSPRAREDDPERAIHAALGIREEARKLGLDVTAGINTGEVYVGEIGSERHREVTVMGPMVNLAARLQGQAEPGQILVGEATYRQTRRAFEFAPLALELKGIAGSTAAYAAQRPLPRPEKARGIEGLRAPLIGREKECSALIEAVDSLVQERRGQIVSIVGEAGIGKTRLVSELKAYLEGKPVRWLEGRCISIGQGASFWPFVDLMRAFLGISGQDSEADISRALVQGVTDLFPEDAEKIIPYLGQLLSVRLEERYGERLRYAAPEQVRRQTLLRMRDFLVTLSRRQPLVLILEDLHWADDLSLDLLWVLMDEVAAAPILLVCLYRPEREHGCREIDSAASSKHLERYTPIRLKPLTRRESQQLVEALLAVPNLPPATRAAILANTEGNPFFVEEVVRLLIERGVIYREEGAWKAQEPNAGQAGGGELTVPDTVKSVILSRVDRLEGEVRHVLQCAAVIGRVFRHRLLQHLDSQNEALERHLALLEAHELVYKERTVPELEYAFKHVLTQETAYETILNRHRKTFHRRVGEAIEALYQEQPEEYYELLAFHYSRSDSREKAVEYLDLAAQKAAARYANQDALNYYEKALSLAEGTAAHDAILARRAKFYVALYRGHEAAADYERLLRSARQEQRRPQELEALLGLGAAHYLIALDDPASFSPARSYELYQSARDLARDLGDRKGMARALLASPNLADCGQGSHREASAHVREALAIGQEIGDEELILDCRVMLGKVDRELPARDDELLADLEARHDLRRQKEVYWRLMIGHGFQGNYRRVVECCDASVRLAGEIGVPPVMYPSNKAMALLCLGRYGEAWRSLQEEVADEAHRLGAGMRDLARSTYYLDLMALDRAEEVARGVIELGRLLSRLWMSRWGQILLTTALLRAGKLEAAMLTAITGELETAGWPLPVELLAEVSLAEGRPDEALQRAEKAILDRSDGGNQYDRVVGMEMKLRALTRLDQAAEAVAVAEDALRIADDGGYLPLVWRLREAKAEALSALGETDAAAWEYQAAARVIRELAESVEDADLRQGFLARARVAVILAAAEEG
jgi:class 3 adenylate cyclase/tetratricopeptide (TPR) repeat protein